MTAPTPAITKEALVAKYIEWDKEVFVPAQLAHKKRLAGSRRKARLVAQVGPTVQISLRQAAVVLFIGIDGVTFDCAGLEELIPQIGVVADVSVRPIILGLVSH